MRELALHAPFEDLGTVHAALAAASAEKLSETFDTAGTRLLLRLPADDVDALKLRMRDATRNRVRFDDSGQWLTFKDRTPGTIAHRTPLLRRTSPQSHNHVSADSDH